MYVGMPVYISKNMAVELGLTNGTSGKIKFIHLKNAKDITEDTGFYHVDFDANEDYIIVELDDVTMMGPLRGLLPDQIPITPMKANFKHYLKGQTGRDGKPKYVSINRLHFPIVPRFGITAHKSQGMTLDKAVVDLVPVFKKKSPEINFAYVPLSRVRRLVDLSILRLFPLEVLKAQVNPSCAAMMTEFRQRDLCKDM